MKKVLSIVAIAALSAGFVACGPSAEEKAKLEAEATRKADSIKAALEASLTQAVDAAAAVVDSAAAATTETTAPATEEKH